MKKNIVLAAVPIAMEFPPEMLGAVQEVLRGEYESGYFGQGLRVLDIGANVGSFAIWASHRWPDSEIHCYEPHPGTFKMLTANVAALSSVTCHNAAVFPSDKPQELFWTRYDGDGESGLARYMDQTFDDLQRNNLFEVAVIHPRALPEADVIKVDAEGAEAAILCNMDLTGVSLILLEYQNAAARDKIQSALQDDFVVEYEDRFAWDALLQINPQYSRQLEGDEYGRLFLVNKNQSRLQKFTTAPSALQIQPATGTDDLSFLTLLAALPRTGYRAVSRRVQRIF